MLNINRNVIDDGLLLWFESKTLDSALQKKMFVKVCYLCRLILPSFVCVETFTERNEQGGKDGMEKPRKDFCKETEIGFIKFIYDHST